MNFFKSKDPFHSLEKQIGKQKIFRKPEDLSIYSFDASTHRESPRAVVLAENTEDIVETVRFAINTGIPISARGAGSGLSGGSVPVEGGIVLSLEKLRKIETIDLRSKTAIVSAGVTTQDLQIEVARHRLFYPPDPSSFTVSTIGGNVAENAGGLRCFKYGVTSHYVRGLEYVNGEGDVSLTGTMSNEGYSPDLTALLVGSEGTLGIISRIELKLIDKPEFTRTMAVYFQSRKSALETVENIVRSGLIPSVMEFIDALALKASAKFAGVSINENAGAMLLIETDGGDVESKELMERIRDALTERPIQIEEAIDGPDSERLWKMRRSISPSLISLSKGRIHEDIAVPRSMLGALIDQIEEVSRQSNLPIPVYGHAGDGNLHVVILFDSENESNVSTAREASSKIFKIAIDLGGTITGEHGVGIAKRDILGWQISEPVIENFRRLKRQMDPHSIFNPGKIFR